MSTDESLGDAGPHLSPVPDEGKKFMKDGVKSG